MQAPVPPPSLPAIISVEAAAAIAVAVVIAAAVALIVGSLTRRLLHAIAGERLQTQHITAATVKAVRRVTFVLALFVLAFPALDLAGVRLDVGLHPGDLTRWLTQNGARIILLVLLAFAANRFAGSVIRSAEHEMVDAGDLKAAERRKRMQTVAGTLRRFFSILIWTAAALMVLRELDVDISPVLTGAGIVGLAVGFGAQTLVKDIISGLFLIAEDQVRIGDSVEINGIVDAVEEINLRTIVLRDLGGTVHYIASGEIRTLANQSKEFGFALVDVGVSYDEDTDRVVDEVRGVAATLTADPAFAGIVLEPLEVLGVDAFTPTEVTLRFRIKTMPMKQADVGRELRRRIKRAFDAKGIHMPHAVTIRHP